MPEDIHHRLWVCPRRHAGAAAPALAALPQCTRLCGIPVEMDEVTGWRKSLPQDRMIRLPGSRRYYTDGSCCRPRLPEVRVAAWAVKVGGAARGLARGCKPSAGPSWQLLKAGLSQSWRHAVSASGRSDRMLRSERRRSNFVCIASTKLLDSARPCGEQDSTMGNSDRSLPQAHPRGRYGRSLCLARAALSPSSRDPGRGRDVACRPCL